MQPTTGRVRTPGRAAGHRRAAVTLRIMAFTDDLDGDRFFALRTFGRDGVPVTTAIWPAPADGR